METQPTTEALSERPLAVLRDWRSGDALVLMPGDDGGGELLLVSREAIHRRIPLASVWSLHVDLGPMLYLLLGPDDEAAQAGAQPEIVGLPLPGARFAQVAFLEALVQLGRKHSTFLRDGGFLINQLQQMRGSDGEPLVQRQPLEPPIDRRSLAALAWGVASLVPLPGMLAAPMALARGTAALVEPGEDAARVAARIGVVAGATSLVGWPLLAISWLYGRGIAAQAAPMRDLGVAGWQWAVVVAAVLGALLVHEYAHALVAYWRGDRTAKRLGRLTLAPWRHVSFLGTIVVPLVLTLGRAGFVFGWAKPVPIVPPLMRHPRTSVAEVGFAGPAINYILALIAGWWLVVMGAVLGLVGGASVFGLTGNPLAWVTVSGVPGASLLSLAASALKYFLIVNVGLATFNMLPIPPLDGSKIVSPILPEPWRNTINGRAGIGIGLATLAVLVLTRLYLVVLALVAIPIAVVWWTFAVLSGMGVLAL